MVTESALTAGQLSAFLLYAAYVTISLSGLSSCYSEMMKGLGASTRLWQLIDKRPDIPISGGSVIPAGQFQGAIQFRDISFAYPTRTDAPIFNKLNLDVPAGSVTAIVGSSGSGKSTLASLILRFYDPTDVITTNYLFIILLLMLICAYFRAKCLLMAIPLPIWTLNGSERILVQSVR